MSRARRLAPVAVTAGLLAAARLLPSPWRDLLAYPALGVAPGMALATALPLAEGAFARWALGVTASPLLVSVLAWLLRTAGLPLTAAAWTVAGAGLLAWAVLAGSRAEDGDGGRAPRFAWAWAVGAAALTAGVLTANPVLRIRGDAWNHAGIVWQILERGFPPEDPRFAGLTLNYVWFFNLFVGLATRLVHGDPFEVMALAGAASLFGTFAVTWLLARRVWDDTRAAAGAAILVGAGFNAGAWLTWPLRLVQALLGHHGGADRVREVFADTHWRDARVIFSLNAPYTYMVSFLDKYLHGTPLHYAYLLLALYLWAMVEALGRGARAAWLWGAAAAAGMLLFHGVVGLSALPVAGATLALAWLLAGRVPGWPSRGRLVAFALASAAGIAAAAPYTLAISRGWSPARSGLHHSYLGVDRQMLITLAVALGVMAWIARRSLPEALSGRRPAATLVAMFFAGMLVFSCVVLLPLDNHAKFVWQVALPLAVLAGAGFHDEIDGWRRRLGPAAARVAVALVFFGAPAITFAAYLADDSGPQFPALAPAPGEPALYGWIRTATPPDAVFTDARFRDLVMVLGRRQLLLGSTSGPERAAFPLDQVLERRAVMDDLYGAADSLDRDAAVLARLGRPAYVLLRDADFEGGASPRARLAARSDLFVPVYEQAGYVVYHVRATPLPSPTSPGDAPR